MFAGAMQVPDVRPYRLVLSCEHATSDVPREFRACFRSAAARAALVTHRGVDLGTLEIAEGLAQAFRVRLYATKVTRLLVDTNRSLGHPRLFSEFSRALDAEARAAALARFYQPHRDEVAEAARDLMARGHSVLHLAVHSFTPKLHGKVRRADIGLLYDPSRVAERTFSTRWQKALLGRAPELRTRLNYPYRGSSDCLAKHLRSRFSAARYLGIELELNQALLATRGSQGRFVELLVGSLAGVLKVRAS